MKFLPLATLAALFLMGCSFDLAALRVAPIAPSDAPQSDVSQSDAFTNDAGADAFVPLGTDAPFPDAFTNDAGADAFVVPDTFTAPADAFMAPDTRRIPDTGGFNPPCSEFGTYQSCGDGGLQVCDGVHWSICT